MNTPKVRAWNTETKLMYYSHRKDGKLNVLFNWTAVFEDRANDPTTIPMFSTRIKDVTGEKEIYENDIVSYRSNFKEYIGVVRFKVSLYGSGYQIDWIGASCGVRWGQLKIIGNVFENRELLDVRT